MRTSLNQRIVFSVIDMFVLGFMFTLAAALAPILHVDPDRFSILFAIGWVNMRISWEANK